MSRTWLITGGSGGIGLALALHCLKRGHRVIATTRNVAKASTTHPELEANGGEWLEVSSENR